MAEWSGLQQQFNSLKRKEKNYQREPERTDQGPSIN